MREILFKAKRIDNGEWVEGYYLKYIKPANCCIEHRIFVSDLDGVTWYVVDEITICQYTELTDKNGNKIWENDIVEVKNDKHHFISQIEWDNWCKGFMFQDTKTTACGMDAISDSGCYRFGCEVIGNIFDNPELIGE